jgi:hypothetical protein
MLQYVLLTLSLLAIALLLGATVYESVVMAPNYARDIPSSIEVTRRFLVKRTPAHFFRIISPAAQLLSLGASIVSWRTPAVRWPALCAFGLLLVLDLITFAFHYPRLSILFKEPMSADTEKLRRAAREWAAGNVVRATLLAVALLFVLHALLRTGAAISFP